MNMCLMKGQEFIENKKKNILEEKREKMRKKKK